MRDLLRKRGQLESWTHLIGQSLDDDKCFLHHASYCHCVGSERISNGQRKGRGNTKNGNKYLAWVFVEAAHFAVRYNPLIKRYYQRKRARSNSMVAIKTVAHKLARACYYILRDRVPFDASKAFA